MGDFARHQKLQSLLATGIVTEIDKPLVDDLRPRFGCDVASEVDVELAGNLR